jgi:hypothetical protein
MWKPTNELKSSESEVWYNYTMWIYDLVQSDRYIFPLSLNTGNYYNFSRTGQEGVHVEFRGSEGSPEYYDLLWVWINDGYWWQYPENALEEGKTYDWGVDYAYAFSYDSDSVAYSIAIDYGYGIDPLGGVMPEKHNEFTIKTTY